MKINVTGICALLFALVSGVVAADSPHYSASAGPHRVLTIDQLVLHDAARNKDLPLKIYYPEGAGPFPVIVFSHGLYASKDTYWALAQYWASYGYACIHPSHDPGHQLFVPDLSFRRAQRVLRDRLRRVHKGPAASLP